MSTCAVVRSFIESKTTEAQTLNVGFISNVSDYLVVHTGPGDSIQEGNRFWRFQNYNSEITKRCFVSLLMLSIYGC